MVSKRPIPSRCGTSGSNPSPFSGESVANSVICKGGPAASFRGRHKRVRDSNAAPHSDDVRTGSTAVDADGQSEHVSLATRPGHAGHQVETDISLLRSETTVKTRPRLAPTDWSAETAAGATST